ncbi:MAG: arginine repressor [Oscillospiraceae bacterium]|nr:arginine repressor [Oscillospiraceae bacterium]
MKNARQAKILEIIAKRDIDTQNNLLEALQQAGVKSTQATVSRDIRELRLVKELTASGGYRYTASSRDEAGDFDLRLRKIFRECVKSYAVAQNLVVIKTLPGLANGACSALDSMNIPHLVGSIAGDDTVFLAMTDLLSAEAFCRELKEML